jgi:AraC-like DNA-binding protein
MPDTSPHPDAIPRIEADLKPSADGRAFELYRANSAPITAISLPTHGSAADFWFKTESHQLPDALIFHVSAAAQRMRRGPEQLALGADQLMISAQVTGQVSGRCGDRDIRVDPGDIAIYDYVYEYETVTSAFDIVGILVARERLPPLFQVPGVHGTVVRGDTGAGRMIYAMLDLLVRSVGSLTLAEADAAVDGLVGVLAAALPALLAREKARFSGDPLLDNAVDYIDAHIGRADLVPRHLEKQLAMSRSALYRLFEPLGGVSAVILRRRLDRSLKELLAGLSTRATLRGVAQSCGFRSEIHFSRAFRARFGVTPRVFRDMVGRKDHAALTAQARRAGFTSFQAWIDHASRRDASGPPP